MDRAVDGAAGAVFKSPLNPVQITKRAEKQMNREKLVSQGRQYAPTLYNVLVNEDDDRKLSGFYPTLAGEIETYLRGKANEGGMSMDGEPLVRFIVDGSLKRGKFDVIAENVAAPIVAQLREEEMARYGLAGGVQPRQQNAYHAPARQAPAYQSPVYNDEPAYQAQPGFDDEPVYDDAPAYASSSSKSENFRPTYQDVPADDDYYDEPDYAAPAAAYDEDYDRVPNTARFVSTAYLVDLGTGAEYALNSPQMSIGRERGNDIALRDANISRSHAEIFKDGDVWVIRDLGSTNGTLVNDGQISEFELMDGDVITMGMTSLEFREG